MVLREYIRNAYITRLRCNFRYDCVVFKKKKKERKNRIR